MQWRWLRLMWMVVGILMARRSSCGDDRDRGGTVAVEMVVEVVTVRAARFRASGGVGG